MGTIKSSSAVFQGVRRDSRQGTVDNIDDATGYKERKRKRECCLAATTKPARDRVIRNVALKRLLLRDRCDESWMRIDALKRQLILDNFPYRSEGNSNCEKRNSMKLKRFAEEIIQRT